MCTHECLHACVMCTPDTHGSQKSAGPIGTGIMGGCELPCGCWELNSSPLQVQQVLLTAEPFLELREKLLRGESNVHDGDIMTEEREGRGEPRRSRETGGNQVWAFLHHIMEVRSRRAVEPWSGNFFFFLVHLPHPLHKIQENSFNLRMNNKTELRSNSMLLLRAGGKTSD